MGILNTQQNWSHLWTSYAGFVRVVFHDTSIAYGETTGEILAEQYQQPGMAVLLESGKEVWVHPEHVWPMISRNNEGGLDRG